MDSWPINLSWSDIRDGFNVAKEVFSLIVYFLVAVAAIGVLWRLPMIARLLKEFQTSSGPIWDMRRTVEDMKQLVPTITDRLKALQSQVVEIQRNSADDLQLASSTASEAPPTDDWEVIKKMWKGARDRLEQVIDSADGRRTRKYEAMPRYDYTQVIDNLVEDGYINQTIADDARFMNDEFLSLRNRKRPITEETKKEFGEHKARFDREIEKFKPSPRPVISSGSNGSKSLMSKLPIEYGTDVSQPVQAVR